ncbi:MAG TPA: hypothetical protein PK548_03765, partial [Bacteroidales bacterium]|nr:hypothetical protein [Bacteroidales bacterium]HQA87223.1 hypothetical protein [Bacteroidales bacterium]
PQRLPPLRAFHLSASRNQLARVEILNFEVFTLFGTLSNEKFVGHSVRPRKLQLIVQQEKRNFRCETWANINMITTFMTLKSWQLI